MQYQNYSRKEKLHPYVLVKCQICLIIAGGEDRSDSDVAAESEAQDETPESAGHEKSVEAAIQEVAKAGVKDEPVKTETGIVDDKRYVTSSEIIQQIPDETQESAGQERSVEAFTQDTTKIEGKGEPVKTETDIVDDNRDAASSEIIQLESAKSESRSATNKVDDNQEAASSEIAEQAPGPGETQESAGHERNVEAVILENTKAEVKDEPVKTETDIVDDNQGAESSETIQPASAKSESSSSNVEDIIEPTKVEGVSRGVEKEYTDKGEEIEAGNQYIIPEGIDVIQPVSAESVSSGVNMEDMIEPVTIQGVNKAVENDIVDRGVENKEEIQTVPAAGDHRRDDLGALIEQMRREMINWGENIEDDTQKAAEEFKGAEGAEEYKNVKDGIEQSSVETVNTPSDIVSGRMEAQIEEPSTAKVINDINDVADAGNNENNDANIKEDIENDKTDRSTNIHEEKESSQADTKNKTISAEIEDLIEPANVEIGNAPDAVEDKNDKKEYDDTKEIIEPTTAESVSQNVDTGDSKELPVYEGIKENDDIKKTIEPLEVENVNRDVVDEHVNQESERDKDTDIKELIEPDNIEGFEKELAGEGDINLIKPIDIENLDKGVGHGHVGQELKEDEDKDRNESIEAKNIEGVKEERDNEGDSKPIENVEAGNNENNQDAIPSRDLTWASGLWEENVNDIVKAVSTEEDKKYMSENKDMNVEEKIESVIVESDEMGIDKGNLNADIPDSSEELPTEDIIQPTNVENVSMGMNIVPADQDTPPRSNEENVNIEEPVENVENERANEVVNSSNDDVQNNNLVEPETVFIESDTERVQYTKGESKEDKTDHADSDNLEKVVETNKQVKHVQFGDYQSNGQINESVKHENLMDDIKHADGHKDWSHGDSQQHEEWTFDQHTGNMQEDTYHHDEIGGVVNEHLEPTRPADRDWCKSTRSEGKRVIHFYGSVAIGSVHYLLL